MLSGEFCITDNSYIFSQSIMHLKACSDAQIINCMFEKKNKAQNIFTYKVIIIVICFKYSKLFIIKMYHPQNSKMSGVARLTLILRLSLSLLIEYLAK